MKHIRNAKIVALSILLLAGLAACNKPGPAETAGKNIDQTVDKAGKKIDDASDKVKDKIDEKK